MQAWHRIHKFIHSLFNFSHMRLNCTFLFITLLFVQCSFGQNDHDLLSSLDLKEKMADTSLLKNILFKNIGPSVMSGRVVDLDVNPEDPTEFYVAYASGGLWHTLNNGTSFTPVMDNSLTQNIGDIAIDWKTRTIWVGTGESNASRSSYSGIGILKSTDNGENWEHMGLSDSHHISKILINPDSPDELVVGVTGHLYSTNEARGIYRTSDGGKTWDHVLFVNNQTGIIDLAAVPGNFNIQFAASWQKERKAWNFDGSGEKSAIYKSVDGGKTWRLVTGEQSGFPTGNGVGRIGLAVFDDSTIYAVHDNQYRRPKKEEEPRKRGRLHKNDFKEITRDDFLKLPDRELDTFLRKQDFPKKYSAQLIKEMVRSEKIKPQAIYDYLSDANSMLFEFPVIGAEVYRSEDGGKSWVKMNEDYIDDLYYSYGYYFGLIRVDPNNKERIYLGGVPLLRSEDGGRSFSNISSDNVHADHHALWINPEKSEHLINGNDGGVNISYDGGEHWIKNNSPTVGQFYAINVDYQKPYNVYGGLQDNGVWMGPHNAEESSRWQQTGHYPWKSIMSGDGMQVQIDRGNPHIVYTGFQFGNYYRLDLVGDFREKIQPRHELGKPAYRFNWETPILLSTHNQDIVYLGSNVLHRSMNRGKNWEEISGDLSKGSKEGNVAYGTITCISESPFRFGMLYVGTDDGLAHMSRNGGENWINISDGLPGGLWVSEVLASRQEENRVYICLNGYRKDDFTSYIYMSDNQGQDWKDISSNLPDAPVNTLVEDPFNANLLFAGTDIGLFASLDRGQRWEVFQNGIPNVAVHDLVIQDKAGHLLVGTHGRSIYLADISDLEQLSQDVMASKLHIFPLEDISHSDDWGDASNAWKKPETPGLDVVFYSSAADSIDAVVRTTDGIEVSAASMQADRGMNILSYDLAFSKKGKADYLKKYKRELSEAKDGKTYLPKGTYEVEIRSNDAVKTREFAIKD